MDNDDDIDIDDFGSHASISAFPQSYTMQQPQWNNNKLGLNQLKNQDIANSFRDYQPPTNQPNQYNLHHHNYDHIEQQQTMFKDDIIDDHHDEVPYDTIIFHQNLMTESIKPEQKIADNNNNNNNNNHIKQEIEYYSNTTIVKNPNPNKCCMELTKQFERVFEAELDIALKQGGNDGTFGRKTNWKHYDLGWRNKFLFSPLLKTGKLFTCMKKEYFQQDKIAHFHEIKELNTIETHPIITGLEKILGKEIYFELIDNLLKVHKKYYFDKKDEWKDLSNGDKLQELCDSFCGEIKNMLSFVSIKQDQYKLGSKILTKFYDALQLILALYAPRCGSGQQSNLKIPEKHVEFTHFDDDLLNDPFNDFNDDDHKMNFNGNKRNSKISYNELFARRYNLSQWLQNVIKDEIDAELKKYDEEINKVHNGLFQENENEDEKKDKEEDDEDGDGIILDNISNKLEIMSDIKKNQEICRWKDEKIFTLLTANRKLEAAALAIENGDYRLSTLIAQSPHFAATDNKYQPFVDIRNQIDYWKKNKIWETFNVGKRKIYALLAGRYVETVDAHKFNWFRCFGILIWFYLPINWVLSECISNFDDHTEIKKHPFIKPYLTLKQDIKEIDKMQKEKKKEILNKMALPLLPSDIFTTYELNDKFPNDICYELLRMKCSMIDPFKSVFNPRNIQPFKLEYLFNFFLHDLLFESGIIDIEENVSNNIYHSFIEQLERMGYWHWAIYLSLFIAKQNNLGLKCNYNHMTLLILQRNINKPIPKGFNTKIIPQKPRLIELTFADLRPTSTKMEIDHDNNDNNNQFPDHYIYCDKSEEFAQKYLNKYWNTILDETTIDGLKFLVHIGIEEGLIIFCLAQYAESIQDWFNAFRSYSNCSKWNKVHQILMDYIFFDWMMKDKIDALQDSLQILQTHCQDIIDWNDNGMIIYQYIKVMQSIQSNPDKNIETNINSIKMIKQGINKMLDNYNDDDNDNDNDENENDDDLKKRVCLMTMEQRLDTCLIHLIQNR